MKTLKLAMIAVVMCGCTYTKVDPNTRQFTRWSFLQRVEFSEVTVKGESVTLRGYRNDGGIDAAERITAAAVTAVIQGAKP